MAKRVSQKTKNNHPALAKPGDPLVTFEGKLVAPEPAESNEEETATAEAPKTITPRSFRAAKRRSMRDLPCDATMFKAVSCVFVLTIMGVGDREIADDLKISAGDLKSIRAHPAYAEAFNTAMGEFLSENSTFIQARIAAYGNKAVDTMADVMEHAKKPETKLSAASKFVEYGGHSKAGGQQAGQSMGDFRITLVDGDKKTSIEASFGAK